MIEMSRVSLYLKKSFTSVESKLAQFGECIVDYFGFTGQGCGYVGLTHQDNCLTLYGLDPEKEHDSQGILLKHAWRCPVHCIDQSERNYTSDLTDKGVGIGVAVLLTSSDNHVLIKRYKFSKISTLTEC